ncbi:MAG: 50S ribosomal protein L18e [Candidatus Woesearchaeota archaeon]
MKTNTYLKELIINLDKISKDNNIKLWAKIAKDLKKSTRNSKIINLNKINHLTKENDVVVVPGKILGNGELEHKLTIIGLKISSQAKDKLKQSKSEFYLLDEIIQKNPKIKNVRILV